jgi:hypothetical protein
MIGVIPNPKKVFTIPFSISETYNALKNIPNLNTKYSLYKLNETFNSCVFDTTELLSLGVYIDFNLNEISDNKTEVTIEVRRKIGSFDKSHEVTLANNHIVDLVDTLSNIVGKTDIEIQTNIKENNETAINKKTKRKNFWKKFFLVLVVIYALSWLLMFLLE